MNPTARIAATFNRSGTGRDDAAAAAVPAAARGSKGTSAPAARRARATLATLALAIAALFASAAPASAATAEMGAISNVSYTSAHVTGKTTTSGFNGFVKGAKYTFEYSTDGINNWNTGFSGEYFGEATDKEVEGDISGLKGGTEYFIRLFVLSSLDGEATSPSAPPYPSFTTLAVDPPSVLTIDNASDVSYTTATVKGKVNRPANLDPAFNVDCHFQYVTDEQFQDTGFTDNPGDVPCEGTNPIKDPGSNDVEAHLAGLANDTEYHLRLFVSNASPTTDAKEAAATFKTLKVGPPSVKSIDNATAVEYTQAKVKGVVERPNTSPDSAFDVNCNFEYVTDEQFDNNPPGEEFAGAGQVACEPEANPTENPITATGPTPVKVQLTGLAPQTEYHLRLAASNQGGQDTEEAPATFTTEGPVPLPSVIATDAPSEVKYNSAEFTGKVQRPAGDDPALDVNCRFEYVTQAQFEAEEFAAAAANGQIAECEQNTITSEGETTVKATAGLVPDTIYHLRLVAENAVGGSDAKVAANTFTTPEADKPTLTIDPIGDVFTKAHVTGTVTFANGHFNAATAILQVSSDGGATWSDSAGMLWSPAEGPNKGVIGSGPIGGVSPPFAGPYLLQGDLSGLQPSTTYLFRIAATYNGQFGVGCPCNLQIEANGEVAFSPEETVTTEPPQAPPIIENLAVSAVNANGAHFSGTVDPQAPAGPLSEAAKKAYETHWEFVCTPECKDVNGNPIEGTVQGEEGAQTVSGDAKRLDPNTCYEVSLVVRSEGGEETIVKTFCTPLIKPTVKASLGGSDGNGGYVLEGTVNPNGSQVTACTFAWGPKSGGTEPSDYAFQKACSPEDPGAGAKAVTVEAPLGGLTADVDYHFRIFATNEAGTAFTEDQKFRPTLKQPEPCANEAIRKENSSLAMPECRAYEQVTPAGKAGSLKTAFSDYSESGDAVAYSSEAGNLAKSGQNQIGTNNYYVTTRTATGWETIPNLNGSSGSFKGAPSYFDSDSFTVPLAYSPDFLSSLWIGHRKGDSGERNYYLRSPDGTFTLIGRADLLVASVPPPPLTSADLSHVVVEPKILGNFSPTLWGPGMYEFIGTGVDVPRRVDVDNSGAPLATCVSPYTAVKNNAITPDGREIVFTVPGGDCFNVKSPDRQIWARVNGTTSFHVSASQCTRVDCNGPAGANFAGAAEDGSRVFFTTTQQLLNGDTDQTNDIYACDIPAGSPAPIGTANPCASLIEVSGGATEAKVEPPLYSELVPASFLGNPGVTGVSRDGSTVSFMAEGVLATNEDALGEEAVAGDHNLYVWRTDDAHPTGQALFVGRLNSSDLQGAQATPDGRYLVFTTASQLVPTDTDNARDVYRYDADTGTLTRASTNVFGVAGNGEGFDASAPSDSAVSDDGQKIVFSTAEALSAADGNGEPDAYLWTPARVSLITAGAVGSGAAGEYPGAQPRVAINGSGRDIYFMTAGALTSADSDDLIDVYDARVGGGFSFAPKPICTGEACQPSPPAPPYVPVPATTQSPADPGNVKPKTCPKGKVLKGKKCVKKNKKHHRKNGKGKKASHKQGGGK